MSKPYSNLKPNITVENIPVFSACFDACGISPVSELLISGFYGDKTDFSIGINCVCDGENVFSFAQKKFEAFSPQNYEFDGAGKLIVKFLNSDFKINSELLSNTTRPVNAEIKAVIIVDENTYEAVSSVRILPCDEWAGAEYHPETLASFVTPEAEEVENITSGIKAADRLCSFADAVSYADEIVRRIRGKNIICAKKDSYSPEKTQNVKTADMLTSKSAVVATPVELALLFSSCAYKCGMKPVVAFAKNAMGVASVFCGVTVASTGKSPVIFESLTKIRKAVENGEMILFDPAVMSSAHNVDVAYANNAALSYLQKSGTDIIFALNVASAFGIGIKPLAGKICKKSENANDAREVLAKLYTGLVNRPVFSMLGGEYTGYDVIPFIGADADKLSGKVIVRPLEISEKIEAYAGLSDGFAAFALKNAKQKQHNKAELEQTTSMYASFRQRIAEKKNVVAGIYENVFHERISRMTFGNTSGMSNYLICGFVRLTEASSGEIRYLPACFKKIEMDFRYDYSFIEKPSRLVVNTVLASHLAHRDVPVSGIDTAERAFDMFESLLRNAKGRTSEFSEIKLIKEYALIKADLSDFILWNDMKQYGRKMLTNNNFSAILSGKKELVSKTQASQSVVMPVWMPDSVENKLSRTGNFVIRGSSVSEKTDVVINKIYEALSSSEKVLVASANDSFLDEIGASAERYGLSDAVLSLNGGMSTAELIGLLTETILKSADYEGKEINEDFREYEDIRVRIASFNDLIVREDNKTGISLTDAVKSYYSAIDAPDGKVETILPLKETAFENITGDKFNMMFEMAERLVKYASQAQKTAELSESQPIKLNPMFPLNPEKDLTESQLEDAFDLISRILSVFSEYRENLYDISDELGIELADIKTLGALYSLNELYKLIISARELDIPADFADSNICEIASDAGVIEKIRQRIENIEYRLKFFSKELFEDVDTLLSGYNYNEDNENGFIKKFIARKNSKDILLQYVAPGKKGEFNQHDTEEIYKLLNEYRTLKTEISGSNTEFADENGVKLAALAREAARLICGIYPEAENNSVLLNKRTGRVFNFIRKVTDDAAMSKKLTYTRAKFAQVYSDNDCMISRLASMLGADFESLTFDGGILGYDGFGGYLRILEQNLPSLSVWIKFLEAKRDADMYFPSFCEYITENGIKENTDRIFAASLILPAIAHIEKELGITKQKAQYDEDTANYSEVAIRARRASADKAYDTYKRNLKEYAMSENLADFEQDAELSLAEFVYKYREMLFNVYPCILVEASDTGAFFRGECTADIIVCDDGESAEFEMLGAVSSAKSVVCVQYEANTGYVGRKLQKLGTQTVDISYHTYPANRKLCTMLGCGQFIGTVDDSSELSVVTVNGFMRRSGDLANPAEAEVCVSKAIELAQKGEDSIGIFAVTSGQYAYIKHLVCLNAENDKTAAEALDSGKIKVIDASNVCFEKFKHAIVSLGASADKNGNIGWSFGCGGSDGYAYVLRNIANSAPENTVIVTSLTAKDLAKLSHTSHEAENIFCTVLTASQGVIPVKAEKIDNGMNVFAEKLLSENECASLCYGLYDCGADAVDKEFKKALFFDCGSKLNCFEMLSAIEKFAENSCEYGFVGTLDEALNKAIG